MCIFLLCLYIYQVGYTAIRSGVAVITAFTERRISVAVEKIKDLFMYTVFNEINLGPSVIGAGTSPVSGPDAVGEWFFGPCYMDGLKVSLGYPEYAVGC